MGYILDIRFSIKLDAGKRNCQYFNGFTWGLKNRLNDIPWPSRARL